MSIRHEGFDSEASGYDHAPRFQAFEQNFQELSTVIENTLLQSEPQAVQVDDPEKRLLLTADEIEKIWGLFPATARSRSIPAEPVIRAEKPLWFARSSSRGKPIVTDNPAEAISPTAHAMANSSNKMNAKERVIASGGISVHEIPDNGFSKDVKRLVQTGVILHELAHNIVNVELWNADPEYCLQFPNGNIINMQDWFVEFLLAAEKYPPISRYSAAYRNQYNSFPRQGESVVLGVAVNEELTESITAGLLGFVVRTDGLTFEPFKNREEIQSAVQAYLSARSLA